MLRHLIRYDSSFEYDQTGAEHRFSQNLRRDVHLPTSLLSFELDMNECQLHVLDAPRIKTQEAAADFVAKWSDGEGKRNARIDAFLQELLQTYPDTAGAADNIWYESPVPGASTSPLRTLFFKSSEKGTEEFSVSRR